MKILAVSLLRLGDIIMLAPALADIKRKYPEAQLHLLINRQFADVQKILNSVDKYIYFDRDEMQSSMRDGRRSLFEAHDLVSDLIDGLKAEKYGLVYNFTHNRLSAWLCSLIETEYIQGLTFNESGRPQFGSAWFRELNLQADSEAQSPFHIIDVFRGSIGQTDGLSDWGLKESADGLIESAQIFPSEKDIIAIQPLTSDVKKNWGLHRYKATIELIQRSSPQTPIAILCAPAEREKVQSVLGPSLGDRVRLAELSLSGIISFFKRCRVLLTGDTSIKHLAAARQLRTLELVLGSSDHRLTGVYHHGSVIVRSKETCAPCIHSKPCHRAEHFCAKAISPEPVAMLLLELYRKQYHQLATLAAEYAEEIELFRIDVQTTGLWYAIPVGEAWSEAAVSSLVDRFVRRSLLRLRDERKSDLTIGSEVLLLLRLLRASFPATTTNDWKFLFAEFERQVRQIDGRLNSLKLGLKLLASHFEDQRRVSDFVKSLSSLRQQMQTLPFLRSMQGLLDAVIEDDISLPFLRVRKFADAVAQIEKQCAVSLKVGRIIESELSHAVVEERAHES